MKSIYRYRFALLFIAVLFLATCDGGGGSSETRAVIGPEGGTITSRDGRLTLEIPPGALSEDTEITIRKINPDGVVQETDELVPEFAYVLEPDGLVFNMPVTVTYELEGEPLNEEEDLEGEFDVLYIASGGVLEPLTDFILEIDGDQNTSTIYGDINHFSFLVISNGKWRFVVEGVPNIVPCNSTFDVGAFMTLLNDMPSLFSPLDIPSYHDFSTGAITRQFEIPVDLEEIINQFHFEVTNLNYMCGEGLGRFVASVVYSDFVQTFIVSSDDEVWIELGREERAFELSVSKQVECVCDEPPPPTPEPTPMPTEPPTPQPTPEPEGCELPDGVYNSVSGNCGVGSFTLTNSGNDLVVSGFGANPTLVFEHLSVPDPVFGSESTNIIIQGQGGHTCSLECIEDERVRLDCTRPGASCTETFEHAGN